MIAETLHISRLDDGGRGLRLVGELDMASAHLLRAALASLPGEEQVTLDLSELTFMDSSGLHAIVDFARGKNGNGRVILEGASAKLLRVFEIASVATHPSLEIREAGHGS